MTRLQVCVLALIGLASLALPMQAQNRCPDGFNFLGRLHGAGSYNSNFNQRVEIRFSRVRMDRSYRQQAIHAENGQSDAHSNIKPTDIPAGLNLVPFGSDDHEKGWAVLAPELKGVEFDEDDRIKTYAFGMSLYCTTGSGEADRFVGGCDVNVDVCYKPK